MIILLIALGLLPFALGTLVNWIYATNSYRIPDILAVLMGLVFLLIWAALAYFIKPYIKNTKKVLLGLHVIPTLVLILLLIQELFLNQYWANLFGRLTQFYFLAPIRLTALLFGWLGRSMTFIYICVFLLMLGAAYAGCRFRKK